MSIPDLVVVISFLANTGFAGYGIYADKQAFSLNQVFWIFNAIFLGIAPLLQYCMHHFPWQGQYSNTQLLQCNTLILLCMLLYSFVRYRSLKQASKKHSTKTNLQEKNGTSNTKTLVLLHLTAVILWIIFKRGDILSRQIDIGTDNSSLLLLVDKGIKGTLLSTTLLGIDNWQKRKSPLWILLLILGSGILVNLPMAESRYWIACYYLGILLSFFKGILKSKPYWFSLGLSSILLLLFPLLSIARYPKENIATQFPGGWKDMYSFSFLGGDFDAYSSLCNTLSYIRTEGITWGKQLLTVILFFVPRKWWPGKSVGSGALVSHIPGSDFTNISSPLIAEGIINFGLAGAVLFIGLLAWGISRADQWYWQKRISAYASLFYPPLLGLLFFMLRGDLLSSFAYTAGLGITSYLCFRLLHNKTAK